jgi:hypothetical protein
MSCTNWSRSGVVVGLMMSVLSIGCGRTGSSARNTAPPQRVAVETRAERRAELATHRTREIDRLRDYARLGAFPVNTTVAPTGHFFRDSQGHYCAVANLVHQDGRDDLVNDVVGTNNALVVSDVHAGPLHDWMMTSGLTEEELARVQAPAPMVIRRPVLNRGLPVAVAAKAAPLPNEDQMRAAIRAHLATVEAELVRDTDSSLDLAVDRLLASRPSA